MATPAHPFMARDRKAWCSQRGVAHVRITRALFAQPGTTLMRRLCNADLHVWEGLWYSFSLDPKLPESKEAYSVIAKFFNSHLGTS